MLKIDQLSFSFGSAKILNNLCLSLQTGDFGSLYGSSGTGKSTLFKLITGTLKPDAGTIRINEIASEDAHKNAAYMMQDDLMLPWRTVYENLSLIYELGKQTVSKPIRREEILHYLNEVGLSNSIDLYPHELSGGMRQRVSLARTLIERRPLLLLDEPFASLDVILKDQMLKLLKNMQERYGTTVLMITHDFRDALAISDKIFLLKDGNIKADWAIDDTIKRSPLLIQHYTDKLLSEMMSVSESGEKPLKRDARPLS